MYVLRLGIISSLLADSLVSGFTTAAAMHVFTSQIRDLFGLSDLPRRKDAFKLILVSTVTAKFCLAMQTLVESLLSNWDAHAATDTLLLLRFFFPFSFPSCKHVTFALAQYLSNRGKRFL